MKEDQPVIASRRAVALPHITMYPKFHKPKMSQRFLISYSNCFIKPLCKVVSLALSSVYNSIASHCKMLYTVTGIKHNYTILNNEDILNCVKDVNENSLARNIETFDFSTLYTKLSHDDIKTAITFAINLAFNRNKYKPYLSVYNSSAAWVKKPRTTTVHFTSSNLIKCVCFIIDNSYFILGELVFRQLIGIPIGVDPGPFIANLTLWYFEFIYISKLYKVDYASALKLNRTFRLIDDITSINSDGLFQAHCPKIYPASLSLNKENSVDTKANVLDLSLEINAENKFEVGVFDKRDLFKFNVIRFSPRCSNMPERMGYNIFSLQILRFSRICNNFDNLKTRVLNLFDICISLGYAKSKLVSAYNKLIRNHRLAIKFPDVSKILQ